MSRRHAEEAIKNGRVKVNGLLVTQPGVQADPNRDRIEVDGQLLQIPDTKTTVMLNKPRRVITTKSDPEGRKTVMDLLPENYQSLIPVGRLDFDSEGLLLLSNDGDLTLKLTHPRYEIKKIYEITIPGSITAELCQRLTTKLDLEDGPGRFDDLKILKETPTHTHLQVTVLEGRNRFIRRMFETVGYNVERLKRIQIANLKLGQLAYGEYRVLTQKDLELLL